MNQKKKKLFNLTKEEKEQLLFMVSIGNFMSVMQQTLNYQKMELNESIKLRLGAKDDEDTKYTIGIEDLFEGTVYIHSVKTPREEKKEEVVQ